MKINQDMRSLLEKRELQAMKGSQTSASFKSSMETQSGKMRLEAADSHAERYRSLRQETDKVTKP